MIRLLTLLCLLPTMGIGGALIPAGRVVWDDPSPIFGGFSGLEVYPDGHFLTISDRGSFFTGWITREDGTVVAIELDSHTPILDSKGLPLDGRNTDAEGLAVNENGDIYVSFESNHRIMQHDDWDSAGRFLPKHPAFRSLQVNSGLEALAVDTLGYIYAIPERSGTLERPFPVYRFNGDWKIAFTLPRRGTFLITDADFGPDGALYILERSFTWLGGFSTRVRRFAINDAEVLEEVLHTSSVGLLDNMEGISVWEDANGQLRLTMISDDNFNPLQRTIIAEFLIVD